MNNKKLYLNALQNSLEEAGIFDKMISRTDQYGTLTIYLTILKRRDYHADRNFIIGFEQGAIALGFDVDISVDFV